MFGHPLAKQMENWWSEHGQNHESPEWHEWLDRFEYYQSLKFKEWREEHKNEDLDGVKLFGMSKAGGCTREAALKRLGYEEPRFRGSENFTFFLGHNVETYVLATLDMVGLGITQTQAKAVIPGLMASASDGVTNYFKAPALVSVKSSSYKMSTFRKGQKPQRRGFPELPVIGVAAAQPSWYAQVQHEMYGTLTEDGKMLAKQAFIVVGSKDVVKAYEEDNYLGPMSLTFYCELIPFNPQFIEMSIPIWEKQMEAVRNGDAGPAMYYTKDGVYKQLVPADNPGKWNGKNQEITGTFNPCGGCRMVEACQAER